MNGFYDFALTCMSTLISRTRSLWWPQTRVSVANREEGGNVYRFWPDTGVSDVRWTQGCDQNPIILWDNIKTQNIYWQTTCSWYTDWLTCWSIYNISTTLPPSCMAGHRLDNYFCRKSLWQWSNGQINILIAAWNNWPMRGLDMCWLTNERPQDMLHVLTRDMDTSRVMEVFWPRAWCIQYV